MHAKFVWSMAKRIPGIVVLLACLALGNTSASAQFTGMVVFGDSLSDTGNIFAATGGLIPAAPDYFNGRFSNGPIWVDQFAQNLGFTSGQVRNFAYGGAVTGPIGKTIPFPFNRIPTVQAQVQLYRSSPGGIDPNALHVLWAGSNDYIQQQLTDTQLPINNIETALDTLLNSGARRFLVLNLLAPPNFSGSASFNPFPEHNSKLATLVTDLRADHPEATFVLGDLQPLQLAVFQNLAAYGFTNLTTPYLSTSRTDNPDTYLWWDQDYHPTTALHGLIGNYTAALVVPEPGTYLLLIASGSCILTLRARQRRRSRLL